MADTIDVLRRLAGEADITAFCVCQIDFSKERDCTKGIDGCLFHRHNFDFNFVLADENLKESLISLSRQGYILNSNVKRGKETHLHIPMMDFLLPVNKNNTDIAEECIRLLGLNRGYLVDSGSSYHFLGSEPITWDEYRSVLYRALLLAPVTDNRWIAHQLINGSSNLRLGEKNGITPHLVRVIK